MSNDEIEKQNQFKKNIKEKNESTWFNLTNPPPIIWDQDKKNIFL